MSSPRRTLTIGLVGPCGAGKTTLARALRARGYTVRHIAQEHSHVPDMWRRLANPDMLIFLDVSFEVATKRRRLSWRKRDYLEQQRRLAHARQHADLVIHTDTLTPQQVLQQVLDTLEN